ncbi:MAG: ExbD/TolR family protein [Planctomycetota bacterium]|jgi:biopolymer transport protein ExbD
MLQTAGHAGRGFHQTVMSGLHRRKPAIGIRMTPMIDVIFLLLTFFVLTAKFKEPEQILPIILGTASAQTPQVDQTPLAVEIKPVADGCTVTIGAAHVTLTTEDPKTGLLELTQAIQANAQTMQNRPIELYCDDAVAWDHVVKVYDVLYALGAKDITFRIEK